MVGSRWDVLERLYEDNYTATNLAKELGRTLSWVSTQLNELRKAELVDFEKGADKRSKLYSLTNRSRRICTTYFQELPSAPKRVIEDEKEVDIWLKQLASWKPQEIREESMPPDLLKIMYRRLRRVAKSNPTQCLRMADYFLNRIKVDINLESSHRDVFIMLRELAPKSDKVMNELKEEEERLKDLVLGWLRRAKEDPRNDKVDHSREAYLEALRLIRVVLDGRGKKEFFINLFKESIAPPHVTVGGIPAYMWPLRFIDDKADLLRELIEMASEERDEKKMGKILEVIDSFDSYTTLP